MSNVEILMDLNLENGGRTILNEKHCVFQNCCSIDHFLFCFHLIFKKKQNSIKELIDRNLYECIEIISLNLDQNEWNKVF